MREYQRKKYLIPFILDVFRKFATLHLFKIKNPLRVHPLKGFNF